MAIQYYMRGYNTSAPGSVGYVDWVVNDIPDSTATYIPSPYISANISNITVNRTVTSKVDNFLKPFESLTAIGGTGHDGYFFHLNSYDWLHTTPPGPPIPVPSYLTGFSVVRGSTDGITPRDYSTLFWSEDTLKWLFAYNTNGDGLSIGDALPVGMGSLSIDGYLEIGTNPAQSGIIRIPNNQFIFSRNAANTGDGYLIGQDNLNRIKLGNFINNQVYAPGNLRVDGYVRDGGASSLSGFIRGSNNTTIISVRNSTNTQDLLLLGTDSSNHIVMGSISSPFNNGFIFNTTSNSVYDFQINSISNKIMIGDGYIRVGAIPSLSGILRNTQTTNVINPIITIRNLANNNDHILLAADGYDRILHGATGLNLGQIFNTSTGSVYDFQINSISNKIMIGDGYIRSGASPSSVGIFRNSQSATIATESVTTRNFSNTLDLKLLGVDGYDRITHGSDAANKGHIFNTAIDGYYDFRINSSSVALVDGYDGYSGYKFVFTAGSRRHITSVSNTYQVLVTDDMLAINASSAYTITLPANPELGDTYTFKDINGTTATNNIIISGNSNNIDGISTATMNTNFASLIITYTGTQWSIS
jgi:hypothetical protein